MNTITEAQIRQMVANQIIEWMGAKKGSTIHKKILNIYNTYPAVANTPGSYRMSVSDAWCACTVSADVITLGIEKYTGYEISCNRWIAKAQKMGIWVENDDHMPNVGDFCLYAWGDKTSYAKYDNRDNANHIGIVVSVSGTKFWVVEGNMSTSNPRVGEREMVRNGRYIRGFICPDYAKVAAAINAGTVEYPSISADGGYNNGSLTMGQVKEIQKHFRLTPDGYWGPNSVKVTGYTADQAWAKYKGMATVTTNTSTPSKRIASKNPYPVPTRTLKQGMSGSDVKWMQFQLWNLRFGPTGKTLEAYVDGSFGPATLTSLKVFQNTYGLTVDGSCGPLTRAKLQSF